MLNEFWLLLGGVLLIAVVLSWRFRPGQRPQPPRSTACGTVIPLRQPRLRVQAQKEMKDTVQKNRAA